MKRILTVCSTLAILVLVGCAPSLPPATPSPAVIPTTAIPISHVYAFGDSYSDNGNLKKLMSSGPWSLMWEGRASNGPTAVEVLATDLKVELTDYAVGGAKSGTGNVNPLPNTGGLGQIETFKTALDGKSADPQALYFIMIGANDFLGKIFEGATIDNDTLTDQAVNNIVTGVTQLAELGAKRFLIVTEELATLPFVIATNRADQAVEFQTLFYTKLIAQLESPKVQFDLELTVFDFTALNTKIRNNPSDYGLTNITEACQPWLLGEVKPQCTEPDEYYFWDEVHPSRRVHQIFGDAWASLFGR